MTSNNIIEKPHKLFPLLWVTGILIAVCVLLFYFLQSSQEFYYFYREQQQIFLSENDYILNLLKPIGGFAAMVGQWLVQFFVLPYMGAVISTLLSLMAAIFLGLTLRKLDQKNLWWISLTFLPFFLYNVCLQDVYVHYDGLVALTIGCICLWKYAMLPKDRWVLRLIGGIVLSLVLFYLAGSVAVLICLTMLLFDWLRKAPKAYLGVLPLALVLLTGIVAVYYGWMVDYSYAFWTKGYCEYYFEPTFTHTLAWISIPILLLMAWLSARWECKRAWIQPVLSLTLLVLMFFGCQSLANAQKNHAYYTLLKQIHYADTEEWDKLTKVLDISASNEVQMNYLNLGLAHEGRLLSDLFVYPQQNINSLMTSYVQYTDMGVLMSRLYYQMGVIGAAQYQAFSSTVGITYGNPSMTKLLIKTYLINGTYQIAEKQIRLLEKSWYYADWAKGMRKFLYNDDAVMADPELGKMRLSLPDNDGYAMLYGPLVDLQTVMDANPDNREAADYFIAMLLIAKDYNGINFFIDRYYGKGCMTTLPERLQEAVVAIHEHDPEYCRAHGVSEETINRFSQFRQDVLTLRRSGATNMSRLAAGYGKTFWYYMVKN